MDISYADTYTPNRMSDNVLKKVSKKGILRAIAWRLRILDHFGSSRLYWTVWANISHFGPLDCLWTLRLKRSGLLIKPSKFCEPILFGTHPEKALVQMVGAHSGYHEKRLNTFSRPSFEIKNLSLKNFNISLSMCIVFLLGCLWEFTGKPLPLNSWLRTAPLCFVVITHICCSSRIGLFFSFVIFRTIWGPCSRCSVTGWWQTSKWGKDGAW